MVVTGELGVRGSQESWHTNTQKSERETQTTRIKKGVGFDRSNPKSTASAGFASLLHFYSVTEAAKILKLTTGGVWQMLHSGNLQGIPPEDLSE